MRLLSIMLLVLLPTYVLADTQKDQIENTLCNYLGGLGRKDCQSAMNSIHSADLVGAKYHLVPVFAAALKSKNADVVAMGKVFFGPASPSGIDGKGALCGVSAVLEAAQPGIFDILRVARVNIDKVVIQRPEAVVEYSLHVGGQTITDMEKFSLDGDTWKIRTKESPAASANKFRLLFQGS